MTEETKNYQNGNVYDGADTAGPVSPESAAGTHPAQSPSSVSEAQEGFATEAFQASPQSQQAASAQQAPAQPTAPASGAFQQGAYQQPSPQAYQEQVYRQYAAQAQRQHAAQPAAGKGGKASLGKTFGISFAGAALAVVLGLGGFAGYQAVTGGDQEGAGAATIQVEGEDATLAQAVADKALPSIASVNVYQKQQSGSMSFFGYEMPGQGDDGALQQTSLGSGVVISADGYIITNNHVVESADALKVTIDGAEYDAEVVGTDASSDIAVIKADASGLTPIEIGSSSDVEVGEWVMALGNPFGLDNSVSTGIVSALQRSSTMTDEQTGQTVVYPNMIQTDATINPGNSGGALVDSQGKLIGINSTITSYSGSSSGVGFAIPIDYAMGIADQIMDGKTPTHAQLGISMVEVTPEMAQRYDLASESGVYVANVYADSGADAGGIKKGDIIVGFDGQSVASAADLQLAVRGKNPGDAVDVVVNRDGKEQTLSVTLGSDENSLASGEEQVPEYGYGYGNGGGYGGGLFGFGY